ncbi:MAG: tetratricopeptide repeat protein [Christensenellales bacterium]
MESIKRKQKTKILPFDQNADFYQKKALHRLSRNRYIDALIFYKKALEKDSENVECMLSLSSLYTEMNCFDESNIILFTLLKREEVHPEVYFGLSCNFLGLQDYEKAKETFNKYLELSGEEDLYDDIYDMMELLEEEEQLEQDARENCPGYVTAIKGRTLLDQGEYDKAIELLKEAICENEELYYARNNLALAYYYLHQIDKAIEVTEQLLQDDPVNVHACCNLAIFYYNKKEKEKLADTIERVKKLPEEDIDDTQKIALTFCELGYDGEALVLLKKMLEYKPFDKVMLHCAAVASYNLKKHKEAGYYWQSILKLDSHDTIAQYYKTMLKKTQMPKRLNYQFQVPYREIIRRIAFLNEIVEQTGELKCYSEDDSFLAILNWGLGMDSDDIKRSLFSLMIQIGGEKVERILKDFALRRQEKDELKQEALMALSMMGVKEPYMAYIGGSLCETRINVVSVNEKMPKKCAEVLACCVYHLRRKKRPELVEYAAAVWPKIVEGEAPVIRKIESWAAALDYYCCIKNGERLLKNEVCDLYNCTVPTLNRRLQIIKRALHNHEAD